jgi:hypothetical protein
MALKYPYIDKNMFLKAILFLAYISSKSLGAGANPTIASYNASVVKIYSAVNSMARF